jgi:hypothetical protein
MVQIARLGKNNVDEFTKRIDSLHDKVEFVAPVCQDTMYICFTGVTHTGKHITKINYSRITEKSMDDIMAKDGSSPYKVRRVGSSRKFQSPM